MHRQHTNLMHPEPPNSKKYFLLLPATAQ